MAERKVNMFEPQYNKIARDYEKSEKSRGTRYLFDPSMKRVLGDVGGLKVLDFGCGHGYTARELVKSGASKVVGFDLSSEQINIARRAEKASPLGIEYHVFDAIDFPVLGEFDIVMAKFVLHYSSTKQELTRMFSNAYSNLKQEGRLVALVPDFEYPLRRDPKYDYTSSADSKVKEGDKVHLALYLEGKKLCEFDNFHWRKATYEACAKEAGFNRVIWQPVTPSQEGIDRFGKEFFDDYLASPNHTILEAIK